MNRLSLTPTTDGTLLVAFGPASKTKPFSIFARYSALIAPETCLAGKRV